MQDPAKAFEYIPLAPTHYGSKRDPLDEGDESEDSDEDEDGEDGEKDKDEVYFNPQREKKKKKKRKKKAVHLIKHPRPIQMARSPPTKIQTRNGLSHTPDFKSVCRRNVSAYPVTRTR
jgi:hypothetical protein